MVYSIEGDNVYLEYDGIKQHVGITNKTETNRIDAETVEDIAYTFDTELGDYVENTAIPRVTRNEPLPVPEPSELDVIGMQLVEKDLQILELQSETEFIGQQMVEKDLQILDLQQENGVLGQQLVDMDLRLLQGGF